MSHTGALRLHVTDGSDFVAVRRRAARAMLLVASHHDVIEQHPDRRGQPGQMPRDLRDEEVALRHARARSRITEGAQQRLSLGVVDVLNQSHSETRIRSTGGYVDSTVAFV